MANPPYTDGQNWGYHFPQTPTALDSDYVVNTLAYTDDGTIYMIIDSTPDNAVWVKYTPLPVV